MGLRITAYRGLVHAWGEEDDDDNDLVRIHANADFPGREAPLKDGTVYAYDDSLVGFEGGYIRYALWREQLAKLVGYPLERGCGVFGGVELSHAAGACGRPLGPFYELIWFADDDGTLGPTVLKKLAQDFRVYDDRAKQEDADFYGRYSKLRAAAEFAAEDGCWVFG